MPLAFETKYICFPLFLLDMLMSCLAHTHHVQCMSALCRIPGTVSVLPHQLTDSWGFGCWQCNLTCLQLFHHNLRTAVHCNFSHFNNGRKCCSTVVVVFFAWMGIFVWQGLVFFYPRKVLQPRWGLGSTINLLHISPSSSSCPGNFTGYTYPQSTNLVLKYILSDVFVMGSNGHI